MNKGYVQWGISTLLTLGVCAGLGARAAEPSVRAAYAHAQQDQAEALLSQRYETVWATLPPSERAAFSARERKWLNAGRWQEKDRCVIERGPDWGRACLTEVTLRHALTLQP